MKYDDICSVVAQRAETSRPRADRAVKATLQALSEQVDSALLHPVLEQLPPEFAKSHEPPQRRKRRNLTDFLERVATLADLPTDRTRRHVLAAYAALAAATAGDTLGSALNQLGQDYTALLPPPDELLDAKVFLDTVRQRAGADTGADAEKHTHAALHALAERITAGQAADLARYLPSTLGEQLQPAHPEARPFDYAEFMRRISGQRDTAEAYAHAVLTTVREAAPEPEIQDTLAQLPTELARLFV